MSQYKEVEVGGTVHFWFAANTTAGAAGDGATPLYDVRAAGGAASDAPTASGTPTLLTHANYTDGLHEIAIDTTGYTAGEYAVFCTLTISTVNPGGFCGSFVVRAVGTSVHGKLDDLDTEVDHIHEIAENIAVTGSALNQVAEAPTVSQPAVGTETTNTYAATQLDNGVYHVITAASNEIDIYYQFDIPAEAGAVPVGVTVHGYLREGAPAGGDTINMYAYNFVANDWDLIRNAAFTGITTAGPDQTVEATLLARNVDSGGKVRVRFQATSLEAGTTLNIDQIFITYAEAIASTIGLIKAVTDKLDTALVLDGAVYDFTADALAAAPGGDGAISVADAEGIRYMLGLDGTQTQPSSAPQDSGLAMKSEMVNTVYGAAQSIIGGGDSLPVSSSTNFDASYSVPIPAGWEIRLRFVDHADDSSPYIGVLDSNGYVPDGGFGNTNNVCSLRIEIVDASSAAEDFPVGVLTLSGDYLNGNAFSFQIQQAVVLPMGGSYTFRARNNMTLGPVYDARRITAIPTLAEMLAGGVALEASLQTVTDPLENPVPGTYAAGTAGAALGSVGAIDEDAVQAACTAALEAFDVSHSTTLAPGSSLTVSAMVGAAASAGPRQPRLVSDLFNEVRLALNDVNKNLYSDALMTAHYNRAISESWNLMTQVGAEVVMNTGTIIADGVGQDFELPSDFRAFVPTHVLPRSPITATADYSWGRPLMQVGMFDRRMQGTPSTTGSPTAFTVFHSGNSQYMRFSSIPAAGERYDFRYYPEYQQVSVASIESTYTPWLGLLDQLLARILEDFCREGLEFITTKRDVWRAKTENDIVILLGLRHLTELNTDPSLWKGFPV